MPFYGGIDKNGRPLRPSRPIDSYGREIRKAPSGGWNHHGEAVYNPREIRPVTNTSGTRPYDPPRDTSGWVNTSYGSFGDKVLECVSCRQEFAFSAGQQAHFAQKGFAEPKRCPSCRQNRKAGA